MLLIGIGLITDWFLDFVIFCVGNPCATRNVETFQDDFRECPQNTNRITPDNELICYNAATKVDVESKFLSGSACIFHMLKLKKPNKPTCLLDIKKY